MVQMIQYTELLWEMAAKRKGEKVRWRVVVFLEAIKAICRLLLLRLTKSRPLVTPLMPEREVDPSKLEDTAEVSDEPEYIEDATHPDGFVLASEHEGEKEGKTWTMPRTGLHLPSLPDSGSISSYLLSRVLTADDIKPAPSLLHRVSGPGQIAEVLYILRPVIYAMALQHWREDKKSWRPWLIGLSIEYGARQLAKRDAMERAGGLRGLTGLEREELSKRGWQGAWWGMRGAFYENVTKGWIHSFTAKLKNKPLLDMAGGIIEDYGFLWDEYYFSTATM
jgi:peroxin-16